jgi:hypothetical protein
VGLELRRATPASALARSPTNSSQVILGFLPPPNEILAASADLR